MKRLLALCLAIPLYAALPNGITWEVRTSGSNNNGGGFITGASGTDFSQQNSAQNSGTDLASVNGTTNPCAVTSVSHSFVAADVGNILHVTAGTNWTTSFFEIVSVAAGTATLDRACGSSAALTSGTWAEGGALATLGTGGLATALNVTSNIQQSAYAKADATYQVTANVSFTPTCSSGTNGCSIQVNGYTTSRGDNGKITVHDNNASAFNVVSIDNNNNLQNMVVRNMVLDCAAQAGQGLTITANGNAGENIEAKNCATGVSLCASGCQNAVCRNCYSHNNQGSSSTSSGGVVIGGNNSTTSYCVFCISVANGSSGTNNGAGFVMNGASTCSFCISANNTGRTTGSNHGFNVISVAGPVLIVNSVSYGNRDDGLHIGVNSDFLLMFTNSIFVLNQGWGINSASTTYVSGAAQYENYNFFYSNTSGAITGMTGGGNDVTGTADPFTNGAGNVFTLNTTAGGGAAAKAAGFPGAMNAGGTGFMSIGALQPAINSGGAGGVFGFVGP